MDTLTQNPQLQVEYVPVTSLKPEPNNPRKHSPKQVKALARAIGEMGFNNPILIDRHNTIIAGYGRLEAAKEQSLIHVPVIRLEHLTPVQVKAYRIADNRLAELAEWDTDLIKLELQALSELDISFDLTLTGFDMPMLDIMLNPVEPVAKQEPETVIPEKGPPVTRLGDVWLLDKHRIICGDALKAKTYDDLLKGEKASLVFTDPPYNVPVAGHILTDNKHGHQEFAMAAGEMSDREFEQFLSTVIGHLKTYSTNGSIHYICMDWRHLRHLLAAGDLYDELKNICIWNKTNGGMGSLYRSKYEAICVFKNGRDPHVNNVELGKHGRYRTNVWDYAGQTIIQAKDTEMHPTPKPVEMIADAILDCSNRDQIVLDVFGGSGSTLIAAEKTNRQARLIEIEPTYVDTTIRRWQKLTGKQAKLQWLGSTFDEVAEQRNKGSV